MLTAQFEILTPLQATYVLGLAAVLGACFGSFVNCLAYRLVHGGSVLNGRSQCPGCGHALGLIDLVPVFSWLFLRGRCRHCKTKISPRYVLTEVLMAALFMAIVGQYGIGTQTAAYLVLACILLGLSLVDLETFTIPNGFIIAGMAVWLASVWFMRVPVYEFTVGSLFAASFGYGFLAVLVDGLVGAFVVGGAILAFSLLFDKVTGRSSLGGGDVKLLFMVGLYLGLFMGLFNLLLSCIIGLVFSAGWLASNTGKKKSVKAFQRQASRLEEPPVFEKPLAETGGIGDRSAEEAGSIGGKPEKTTSQPFPFGPSIAAATLVTLLAGPAFLTWYLGLFM